MCAVKIGRLGKFDLNPRGELWRKDENRFGHKLLSKFGWSQGKGLGKNEDGISENLKVRIKLGNTGVGWDEKLPIGIDYREYDAVLEGLSKQYQKPGEVKKEEISLEKRSQQFKNRIHYQKFVRGKDISRYSKKDMSCIFLSREPVKETDSALKESTVTNVESRPTDPPHEESAPTYNSKLSVADYFAMKMKNKMGSSLDAPKISENFSQSEPGVNSKKRKRELKSDKETKRMKRESEFCTAEGNSSNEDDESTESSSSSQESTEEISDSKEQFQNVEKCDVESLKIKRKSKKAKKMLNEFVSKQNVENNQLEENNVALKNLTAQEALSLENNSNSKDSADMAEEDVGSKKRKKEQKRAKKAKKPRLETEVSNSSDKISSLNKSDEEEKSSSEEHSIKTEKQVQKKSKSLKNKLLNLKSCLRNKKYSLKEKRNVSFCENISYRIIENVLNFNSDVVLETNEQFLPCSDEDCTDSEIPNEIDTSGVDDSDSSGKSSEGDMPCADEDESCQESSEVLEESAVPECFKLPKCSSANYDSWLETQRIAARMKVYKNMAKRMKRHSVLKKTNLLEIKGYGNWGL